MQEFIACIIAVAAFAGIVALITDYLNSIQEQKTDGFAEAHRRLKHARENFNNADSDYIETATYEIKAAEEAVKAELLRKRRNAV
nr:MAG TPA: Protein of unknown function (DUF2508) [Caudoviricetes sp.]